MLSVEDKEFKYGDNQIAIDEVSITYVQSNDCTEEEGAQSITISARNNSAARFLNIKTESWSLDSIDELKDLIEDFKKRALLE